MEDDLLDKCFSFPPWIGIDHDWGGDLVSSLDLVICEVVDQSAQTQRMKFVEFLF